MEKPVISTKQFIWMLFILFTSYAVLQAPGLLLQLAGRDAWLCVIGGWVMDILLGFFYAYMGIRFPTENFVQYSMTILGKFSGRIVGMVFPLSFLMITVVIQISLSQVISKAFLPNTPVLVILASSYIVVGYAARKGIEVIARVCEIVGPIFFMSFIILFLLLIPFAHLEFIKPQFENGIYPVISGSVFILSSLGICIMMGMYIPICNRPENGFIAKFAGSTMGSVMFGIIVTFTVMVYGYQQSQNAFYPTLQLARAIHYGTFFERIEVIWIMLAVGAAVVTSTNLMWAFCTGLSQITGLRSYKPLVLPAVLVSLALAATSFNNDVEYARFLKYTFPIFPALMTLTVIFLLIMAVVLKKKGEKLKNSSKSNA